MQHDTSLIQHSTDTQDYGHGDNMRLLSISEHNYIHSINDLMILNIDINYDRFHLFKC